MRRLTGNDEFVQFIKTKKYATVMQDKIYTYLSDLEILIKQYWPELLISRYVEDDADKKESLFECINLEQELSIDHLRLQILLSSYIEYLNKHEYQRLFITPFPVAATELISRHNDYMQSGRKVISYLKNNFEEIINKEIKKMWLGDQEKLSTLCIFSLIFFGRFNNWEELKNYLNNPLELSVNSKSRKLIVKIDGEEKFKYIDSYSAMLLHSYKERYCKNTTFAFANKAITAKSINRLLPHLQKTLEIKGNNLTITKLIDWSNYYHEIYHLSPIYSYFLKYPGNILSLNTGSSAYTARKENDNHPRSDYLLEEHQSELSKKLHKFASLTTSKNKNIKALRPSRWIIFLTAALNRENRKQSDNSDFCSFETAITEYVISEISLLAKRKNKKRLIRDVAKSVTVLLELIPFYNSYTLYQFYGLACISQNHFFDIYDSALPDLNRPSLRQLSTILPDFHRFCAAKYSTDEIDDSYFSLYKVSSSSNTRDVYITPKSYADTKTFLFEYFKNNEDEDDRESVFYTLLFVLGYRLGLRAMEVLNLSNFDIQISGNTIQIREHNVPLKTPNAERSIPLFFLTDDEIELLVKWMSYRKDDFNFTHLWEQECWLFGNPASPEYQISYNESITKLAQVVSSNCIKDFSYHWLRHSAANNFLLSLESVTTGKVNLLYNLIPDFDYFEEDIKGIPFYLMKRIASNLLGREAKKGELDDEYGMIQLARIIGHGHISTTFRHYIFSQTVPVILEMYERPTISLQCSGAEFLLGISRPTRITYFDKYQISQTSFSINDLYMVFLKEKYKS